VTPSACPLLPKASRRLSWRDLEALKSENGPELYRCCLEYGQQLWLENLPARALLAVDRALYCDVPSGDPILSVHPLPYAVIRWMIAQDTGEIFTGNARVHYQHLADRVRGARAEIKSWRAWAGWALARAARPELPNDPKHDVVEPTLAQIEAGLCQWGIAHEADTWLKALKEA
jgi:hypothetical protein